jgi:hypothetical protein
MERRDRPELFPIFLDEVKADWRRAGLWGVIPWWILSCVLSGYAVSHFWPRELGDKSQWGTVSTILAGVLTFNGITLAVTWAAIGKVYETISRADFSRFLRSGGVLGTYMFYIHLVHITQIIAAILSLTTIFAVFLVPTTAFKIVLAMMVAATLYAIRWAAGSVTIAQDLAWQFGKFDALNEEERRSIWLAAEQAQTL